MREQRELQRRWSSDITDMQVIFVLLLVLRSKQNRFGIVIFQRKHEKNVTVWGEACPFCRHKYNERLMPRRS